MRTKRWIGALLGLLMLLAFAAQPSQSQLVLAAGCSAPSYETTGGDSGAQMRVASFGDKTCFTVEMAANEVAIVGAFDNRLMAGSTVLHDVQGSIKALKWEGPFQADVSFGQIRLIDASRAQCEFERWFAAEQNFPRDHGYPLDEWAGKTAVCGALDGGGDPTFTVEAKPGLVQPGQAVTFTVTSDPTGAMARLQFDAGNMVDVQTPKAINWTYTTSSHWRLLDMTGGELAAGDVEVLPTRDCFALPAMDKWNDGAIPFSFSTDEDKTGGNILHICGDLPSGYVLLVSGEFVAGESYGVLSTYAGHIDFYVRNAFVEGVAGCSARPEFDRLKAAGGSNLSIFHAPAACSVRQYVPIAKR